MGRMIFKPDFYFENLLVTHFPDVEDLKVELDIMTVMGDVSPLFPDAELVDHDSYLSHLMMLRDQFTRPYSFPSIQLRGEAASRRVWLFDQEITPEASLNLRVHTLAGFAWGSSTAGASQLALAVCHQLVGTHRALAMYKWFKVRHILGLPKGKNFEVDFPLELGPMTHQPQTMKAKTGIGFKPISKSATRHFR